MIDVLKIMTFNGKGVAWASKVAPNEYEVSSGEHFGIEGTLTKEELKHLWRDYKFKVIIDERLDGIESCYLNSKIKD